MHGMWQCLPGGGLLLLVRPGKNSYCYCMSNYPLNSLGFAKPVNKTRVVVAMSGGVDSSVVAALLCEQGYDVIGITLQLYDMGEALKKAGACCAGSDIQDARTVAAKLGIPHYVLDYENRFKAEVMEDFADTYLAGATPIPCIRCNQRVKFRDLLATAKDLGADCLATGHYVERRLGVNGAEMHCAADQNKDQSYFLFATTQEQLEYLRFPLGAMSKTEVRNLASHYDLKVADKPDSQDICFVPQGRYVDVIERLRPGSAEPGDIVHVDGRLLGKHRGIIHYTVGQRRGIDVGGLADPVYVVKLDPISRHVIVGPRVALQTASLQLKELNWLAGACGQGTDVSGLTVKIRSGSPRLPVKVEFLTTQTATVTFDPPAEGVAAGQACVFYNDTRVLGGGWIASTEAALRINTVKTELIEMAVA